MIKRRRNSMKIGVHLPFGPRSPMEFEAFYQKDLGWPNVEAIGGIVIFEDTKVVEL